MMIYFLKKKKKILKSSVALSLSRGSKHQINMSSSSIIIPWRKRNPTYIKGPAWINSYMNQKADGFGCQRTPYLKPTWDHDSLIPLISKNHICIYIYSPLIYFMHQSLFWNWTRFGKLTYNIIFRMDRVLRTWSAQKKYCENSLIFFLKYSIFINIKKKIIRINLIDS